jgi:CBS-domain-containing membrane protein
VLLPSEGGTRFLIRSTISNDQIPVWAAAVNYRHVRRVIRNIEERHVAPIATQMKVILEDLQTVTSTVKDEAQRVDRQDVMTKEVQTVPPTASADEAWSLMRLKRIHHLVVTQGVGVLGVLSDRDTGGRQGASLRKHRTGCRSDDGAGGHSSVHNAHSKGGKRDARPIDWVPCGH